jgi:hypothetical protein
VIAQLRNGTADIIERSRIVRREFGFRIRDQYQ